MNAKKVSRFLAEDYDTDIDHHLDEIRFHRSRVNYINKVTPIGISKNISLNVSSAPEVYTPFNSEAAKVTVANGKCNVSLPDECAYAILFFRK